MNTMTHLQRSICRNCGVPAHTTGGLCIECRGAEFDSEADTVLVEYVGRHGQRIGHRVPRQRGEAIPRRQDLRYGGRRPLGDFAPRDAEDLERYFNSAAGASPVWERSTFGAMCDRIRESTNPDTAERPSSTDPVCPICGARIVVRPITWGKDRRLRWQHCEHPGKHVQLARRSVRGVSVLVRVYAPVETPEVLPSEILEPHGGQGQGKAYGEREIADHYDRRLGMRRVATALDMLPAWAYGVLEARYTVSQERAAALAPVDRKTHKTLAQLAPVALKTQALKDYRRSLVTQAGGVLSLREALNEMVNRSVSATGSSGTIERVRQEAEAMLTRAQSLYASARSGA